MKQFLLWTAAGGGLIVAVIIGIVVYATVRYYMEA